MCAADKPSDLPNDGIVHDAAKQRAWRAAKLRQAIESQTPSEIMEARTGESVARFGIDGLDEAEGKRAKTTSPPGNHKPEHELEPEHKHKQEQQQQKQQPPFTAGDIAALAKGITETVFLLPEQGLIFTAAQLAKELGVTREAMLAMTDEGYERLGLVQIKPYN